MSVIVLLAVSTTSAKMRLFQNVRTYFETIGIYSQQTNQAQSINLKIPLLSLSTIVMFVSTSAYLIFKATAVFDVAICFYWSITRPTTLAIYLTIWLQMPQIIKFIGNCERFVNKSECRTQFNSSVNFQRTFGLFPIIGIEDDPIPSVIIYTKVAVKIEQHSELTHFILMKVSLGVIVVPPIITSYFKYYILGLGVESFQDFTTMYESGGRHLKMIKVWKKVQIQCHFRWPFDEKTPFGCLCQSFFQSAEGFFSLIIVLTLISFLFGSCRLFISFADDIKHNLNALNNVRRAKRKPAQVKQQFCEIVEMFSEVKELSIICKYFCASKTSSE